MAQNDLSNKTSKSPWFVPSNVHNSDHMVMRPAEYIGSFPVEGLKPKQQVEMIGQQLESMRSPTRSTPVIIAIGLSGIKVYNQTGQKIYMGHAMRRISYATCDPEHCQFSFLCREPNGSVQLQYCHVFFTESSEKAEELNNIVGDAFKMSYARLKAVVASTEEVPPTASRLADEKQNSGAENERFPSRVHRSSSKSSPSSGSSGAAGSARKRTTTAAAAAAVDRKFELDKLKQTFEADEAAHFYDSSFEQAAANLSSPILSGLHASHPNSRMGEEESEASVGANAYGAVFKHAGRMQTTVDYHTDTVEQGANAYAPVFRNASNSLTHSSEGVDTVMAINAYALAMMGKSMDTPNATASTSTSSFRSSSELEMSSITSANIYSMGTQDSQNGGGESAAFRSRFCASSAASSQGFRPISAAGSGYGSTNPSPAEHAFRQHAAQTVACPLVLTKENLDQSAPCCTNGDHVESAMRSLSFHSYIQRASSISNEADWPHQTPPPLPLRYDSLRCKYDPGALPALTSKDSGNNSLTSSTADTGLARATWYQANMPREIVLDVLAQEEVGGFVIRESATHTGCYALSVKVPKYDNPSGIAHYLIQRTQRGVKLKGLDKEWPSLHSLVIHLTVMPEMLPCTLRMPRQACNLGFQDIGSHHAAVPTSKSAPHQLAQCDDLSISGFESEFIDSDDEDYQRLSDFSSMMADLRAM